MHDKHHPATAICLSSSTLGRRIAPDLQETTSQDLVAVNCFLILAHGLIPASNRKSRKLVSRAIKILGRCIVRLG